MMDVNKLREDRAKLIADARNILDSSDLNAESDAKFDELMAHADKLYARIKREENLSAMEAEANEKRERKAASQGVSVDQVHGEVEAHKKAFDIYMRHGLGMIPSDLRDIATQKFTNAQGTGSGAAGGFTVPEGFLAELEQAQLDFGGMRASRARLLSTVSGNPLPIPTMNDTSNKGAILGENVQVSGQDATFGAVVLGAYTYTSKLILVSNQLLQDSGFNLNSYLAELLGVRIARAQNDDYTTGSGAGRPTGIITAATSGVTAASATAVTFDELAFDLVHSVDPAYRANAQFMMNDNTLLKVKKLKNGEGDYLWSAGTAVNAPDTIAGFPYIINQSLASMTTGAKPVLFGDFSKYYIRQVQGVQVLRLTERYADYNQVGFLAFQRSDANLIDAGTHPVKFITMA